MRILAVVVGTIFLAGPGVGQGTPPMEFVCLDTDRGAVASGPLIVVSPEQTWSRLEELAEEAAFSHCWSWSRTCPVSRILPGEDPTSRCETDRPLRFRVRVPNVPGASSDSPDRVEITTAPVDMWREVPLSLLPATSADPSTSFAVPRSPGRWRVQARMNGRASAWRDVLPDEDSVELVLQPSVWLDVRVTADHAPLTTARLSLVRLAKGPRRPEELLAFDRVDDSGRIALTLPEQERSLVVIAGEGRQARAFRRPLDVPPRVELDSGFSVRGRVLNNAEESLGGARIVGFSRIPGSGRLMQRHEGKSAPDGRFSLSGFSEGTASVRADHGELSFSRMLDLEDSLDLGTVVLMEAEHIWVRVVDSGRLSPIAEARVQAGNSEWQVDEEGMARLSLLERREVAARAKGYHFERLELPENVGVTREEPFVISLTPALQVEGRFLAADGGTPAAGGRVTARRLDKGVTRSNFGAVEADGRFSIQLTAGTWTLELSAGNAGLLRLEVTGLAGETRNLGDLTAPASAWVSGYVVSPEYEPVFGAEVSHMPPAAHGPLMAWALGELDTVETTDEGYFELFGLAPGTSTLRVEAEGFAPLQFEVEAEGLEWLDAGTLEMSRGRRVTVRSDVRGGLVRLDTGGLGHPRDLMTAALVDRRAVVDRVPRGPFGLTVLDDGVPVCEREEESETGDVDVRCDRNTTAVSGRVAIAGLPGEGVLIWQQKRSAELPEGVVRTVGGGLPMTQAITNRPQERRALLDEEGRYRMSDVLPGAWEVIWMSFEGARQEVREVTVPDGPGEEFVHNFDYSGAAIEGLVVDAEGDSVDEATVDIFPGRRAVVADASGRFQVLGLSPGSYQLRARWRHQRSSLVDAELRDFADREVVQLILMDEPPNEELEIRIAGGDGGFCFVEMESGASQMIRVEVGRARQKLSPPLAERMRIACQADGRYVLTGWRNLRRALDRGVDLDARESDSVIMLVGEASRAEVEITGPGGWDLGALRIWFGGARTFRVGESITNLPEGSYTLRWNDQTASVRTERRRVAEVEIGD